MNKKVKIVQWDEQGMKQFKDFLKQMYGEDGKVKIKSWFYNEYFIIFIKFFIFKFIFLIYIINLFKYYIMKRDNNLFVLRFKDSNDVFYFTKKSYVVHKLGTNGSVVDNLMSDRDYAERRGIYITLEDCSNIEYKYINNIW